MTMQQLQADLVAVKESLPSDPTTTSADLVLYLKHNLLPLIEAHISETGEIDEAVANLVENAADVLHEDTAAVFGSLIVAGLAVCAELKARMGNDAGCRRLVAEFERLAREGEEILHEVTVQDEEDEEPEPGPGAPEGQTTEGPPQ